MTHWLYTTMRPDLLLEVDDAEHADLAAQGLILAEAKPPGSGATSADLHVSADTPVVLDAAETLADDQPADVAE